MKTVLTALLALLALTAAPLPASASTRDDIIADCADDGQLQGRYSPSELRDARKNLPSDVAEYTDCADVLRRAELPDDGSAGGDPAGAAAAGGAGGGALLAPADERERQALRDAAASGGGAVEIDGESVVPGAAGFDAGARRNGVPDSLLGVLALVLLGVVIATYPALRRNALGRLLRRS